MKRILSIAALLCAVSIAWGQNTKKMNSIKRSAQYIYAEATMETTKEAFEVANDLLLIQVKEYAASKKAFRDNDILVRNIQSQQDSLQIRRGPMVKVFLYVKKSDVLNVDNVVLVDNTSSGKNDEEAVTVNVKETPTATSANAPAEQDSAEGDTSLRLGTSWQQAVIDQLLSAGSYSEARSILARLKAEFKIKKTGPREPCGNPEEVFILVGKNSSVVTVLGPGGTSRTDFKSLRKTSDNYNGYDKYWFKFSK